MFNQARRQGMAVRTLIEDLELGMRKKAVVSDDLSEITDEIEKETKTGTETGVRRQGEEAMISEHRLRPDRDETGLKNVVGRAMNK